MVEAYKDHFQFIMVMTIMYIAGVWGGPIIYPLFPLVLLVFGLKGFFFELLILTIWILMLSDYVPVRNATYDDLQFAKDLKIFAPLALVGFMFLNLEDFKPFPKIFINFLPFLVVAIVGLNYSINLNVGIQKTISYAIMYFAVPAYVVYLDRYYGERFWKALLTFLIGMLTIGVVLRFVAPQIALIEGTSRFKSVLGNPNGLGIFLNLTFILWLVIREFQLATFTRKENSYIFLILAVSVIWSGSRNGMMSMFMFYMMYRLIRINWFLVLIVVAAIIGFQDQFFEFFISIIEFFQLENFFRVESLEEGSGRKIAWVFAWDEIQKYFFVGGGFGHDEHIMRPNYAWLARLGHQGGVHNSYLSMWFDTGIVGVILYFAGFVRIVFASMRQNYLVLAFGVTILFNIVYESWIVGSLNPFTIIFLINLTIFSANLGTQKVAVAEEVDEMEPSFV